MLRRKQNNVEYEIRVRTKNNKYRSGTQMRLIDEKCHDDDDDTICDDDVDFANEAEGIGAQYEEKVNQISKKKSLGNAHPTS